MINLVVVTFWWCIDLILWWWGIDWENIYIYLGMEIFGYMFWVMEIAELSFLCCRASRVEEVFKC